MADAGPDGNASAGGTATLDGSRSRASAGALSYTWRQVAGPRAELVGAALPQATVVAPEVSDEQVLRFELRVRDAYGTSTDRVDVRVRPALRLECEVTGPLEASCRSNRPGQPHAWTFGEALATSVDERPVQRFPAPGPYDVDLVVSGPYGPEDATGEVVLQGDTPAPAVKGDAQAPATTGWSWAWLLLLPLAAALALLLLLALRRRRDDDE